MASRLPLLDISLHHFVIRLLVLLLLLASLSQCESHDSSTPPRDPPTSGDPSKDPPSEVPSRDPPPSGVPSSERGPPLGGGDPPPSTERSRGGGDGGGGGGHGAMARVAMMMEMQAESKPRLGLCWSRALAELRAGCERLGEEAQRRVALAFTRCHLRAAGRALPSCPQRPRDPRACTRSMDPVAFSAYTEFYTHAHSVCHHLRAQAWRDDAESLLSVLARGSSRFSRQLRRSAELGESILTSQGEFARAQHRAARSGESLRRALAQSQKGVRVAFSELRGSALESRALFAESLRRLSALQALLAGDLGGLHAALLYALCCPLAWILTTATTTARARPWLFVLLTAQLLLERGVTTIITWGAPAGPNVQDEVWLFSWWSRRVALLMALLLLLFAHHSFRDLPALNHRLLVTLVAQQRQLTRHLLVARQKPPGKGNADTGTPTTELSILSGAPDVEGERGSGGMQLSIRRDSSLQLWSPARGPRPFRSPGGVRREVQVERRGLHDSIFIANISSSVLRCRLRERGPGSPPSPCMPHHDAQRRVRRGVSPDGAFPRRVQDMEPPARASSGGAFTRSRLQDQSSGSVQDQASGRVQDKSPGRVQDQTSGSVRGRSSGRVQDKSPGRVQDQASGSVRGRSSGRVQDKSPGRVQNQASGSVRGRSSGRVQDKSPGRVQDQTSGSVQGRSSGRVQDKSPGRVQDQSSGRVQDKSPGRVQDQSSGRVRGRSSGRVQDKSPGRVQDQASGSVRGRSSGRVQDKSPGRVQGRSTGRVQDKSSERVQDKSPGRVQGRSSGRVQDKSPGRVQDKSPGKVQGRSSGRVQDKSSGKVQDKSPGRVRGRSPGRVQGRASKGEQS